MISQYSALFLPCDASGVFTRPDQSLTVRCSDLTCCLVLDRSSRHLKAQVPDYVGVGPRSTGGLTDYVLGGLQRYLEEIEGASLESGRGGDDIESRGTGIFGLHMVGDDRGEVGEESLKTVDGQIVWSAFGMGLGLS